MENTWTIRRDETLPDSECTHPPSKHFSWIVEDPTQIKKRGNFLERRGAVICVGCCQCGTVLHGAAR